MRAVAGAVFVVLAVAACGGSAPHGAPAASSAPVPASQAASPSPSSQGAVFCAQLRAASDPQPAYLNAVIGQDSAISSFSTGSPADIERAARAQVAGWIAVWCPQYAYLTQEG